ncbi:Na(+)-translocating NADH-quinone reductase subunit A [Fulvivirgaceae bacterium BMA12]|uniref:Na(+)-translocating NADH-quinone reductase subunit A n=1 Tax=Agaribacillus aureus TaxID=3051825 RepID=A0ABT8L2G4_9BACT|nr:Na(+)-translocating NADH-quinone reductase subunit A [Fulvivirgaceae bacterium BMA12]
MSKFVKLKKGFDIKLAGKAEKQIAGVERPDTYAVKPTDFQGILRPKVLVREGDTVKAGTPVLIDGKNDKIKHTAPVSGEVVAVKRGDKRKLLEIVILADKEIEYVQFPTYTISDIVNLKTEDCLEPMIASGVWPNIIQRPYGIIADPAAHPKSIFISAFDTNPLAPDLDFLIKDQDKYFEAGIAVLRKFSPSIHLNVDANSEVSGLLSQTKDIQINKFSGPHPAGNVGVQIHHIDPIRKGDIVWTVSPFGVVQIGKLFLEGKYDASRLVALTGSEVKTPQYYKTYTGGSIKKIIENNLKSDHLRYVSGNVLTGKRIGKEDHTGFYDNQVTVIPEGDYHEFFGWILPSTKKLSFHRAFGLLSFMMPKKDYVVDTNTHGEDRAFVQTGVFERVIPMDVLPMYLIKAIMAEDFDAMEALGIYEVIEEDLALCEFVDVSKHDIQAILRDGLNLMQYS